MKAAFLWDEENTAHIAEHGHTIAEVERAVQDPRNEFITNRSSGRPGMVVRTRPGVHYAVFWDQIKAVPWTIRVTTMYEVPLR